MSKLSKISKKYLLDISSLRNESYDFVFEGGDDLFAIIKETLDVDMNVEKGNFIANLRLVKSEVMVKIDFDIKGTLNLLCDRSLDEFEQPFEVQSLHVFKYGTSPEDYSDEITVISNGLQSVDMAPLLYELIALQIPMKKLHPRYKDEDTKNAIIYVTETKENNKNSKNNKNKGNQDVDSVNIDTNTVATNQKIDPRWAKLANLANLTNKDSK